MKDRSNRGKVVYTDEMDIGRTPRWMAGSVMIVACAGFMGLAWYAYHAGTRNMRDEELALVEPDSSPVKEKPADPGGMKFPNQDKTIFDAISGGTHKVAAVERVVPGPEEPVSRDQLASAQDEGTKTWINDKLSPDTQNGSNQDALIEKNTQAVPPAKLADAGAISPSAGTPASPAAPATQPQPAIQSNALPEANVQPQAQQPAPVQPAPAQPLNTAAPAPASAPGEPSKVELKKPEPEKPVEQPAAVEEKPVETKVAGGKKKASGKGGIIQLGAYRSEEEAKRAWNKVRGKYHDLSFANPDIRRADLGQKGVFYRLRAKVSDPKAACQAFTAKGQACIVVK